MRWTEDEVRILLMHIGVNSSNLQKAFYDASQQNNHSPKANHELWYKFIKPKWSHMKTTNPNLAPYFERIEKNSVFQPNIKNTPRSRTEMEVARRYERNYTPVGPRHTGGPSSIRQALNGLRSRL